MFPIGYFPDGYFQGGYFPHTGNTPVGGTIVAAGADRRRMIQAILAEEMQRQQSEASKRASLLALLERQRKQQTIREMEEAELRRCKVIATYAVLFSEL